VSWDVRGEIHPPGDKSISHRALIIAAIATGTSRVRGVLDSADTRSTAHVLRQLGASVPELGDDLVMEGLGRRGLSATHAVLECGNSGTTARLVAGVIAGAGLEARFTGDSSLSGRPMRRVAEPLEAMGARVDFDREEGLPMTVRGGPLQGLHWDTGRASAQVKSAILLAAHMAGVHAEVRESTRSRDHTERMLQACGATVEVDGSLVRISAGDELRPLDLTVPGDPSSGAYMAAAAASADAGELLLADMSLNPTRLGFFEALREMGARVTLELKTASCGEPIGNVRVHAGPLRSVEIAGDRVPFLIDEIPLLACIAAQAEGTTRVTGAAELRVKESDRIRQTISNLRAVGARAEELDDGILVEGTDGPLRGSVITGGDHRIAMAFGVLAANPRNAIQIDDPACVSVSYPGFWEDLARITDR
jgi:3-phosphoshikimate 1-carboxyvinyltransferase